MKIVGDFDDEQAKQVPIVKPNSFFTALISLINTVIGAGTLGLPYAFARAGVIPALLLYFFMLGVSYLSFHYLIVVSDSVLLYSYGEVCIFLFLFLSV